MYKLNSCLISGKTQVWHPQTWRDSSMESARLVQGAQAWRSLGHDKGASSELSRNTAVRPHYGRLALLR